MKKDFEIISGNHLQMARLKREITVDKLCDDIKIPIDLLIKIELGIINNIKSSYFNKLLEYLNCPEEYLRGEVDINTDIDNITERKDHEILNETLHNLFIKCIKLNDYYLKLNICKTITDILKNKEV